MGTLEMMQAYARERKKQAFILLACPLSIPIHLDLKLIELKGLKFAERT